MEMCCVKFFLFVCILFTKYLSGDLDSGTLKELIENVQANWDDIEINNERNYNALKRQAVVKLPKYGILQGSIGFTAWTNRTIYQFLNVPYAESPSGNRRFKAPVPIKPWNSIHNAEDYGIKCPTLDDLNKMNPNERNRESIEDCLNMAIYTTNLNASLPVMVYIHGGGYYLHSAHEYPPNYLMERDIVLIVIQYRLDILGFLSTNSKEIPGNAGLMDSVQALQFIKENVEHFGGNPDKITIFGQSSGGAMVSALVISPVVPKDLFHAAIIQSGTIFANWAYTANPIFDARQIAQAAGLNPNQTLTSLNRAFMTMSVYNLLKAVHKYQMNGFKMGKVMPGGRSIALGGSLMPDAPQKIIQSGGYNRTIPIIIGTTKDDGSYVTAVLYDILAANDKLSDKNFMTNQLVSVLCQISDVQDDSGIFEALVSYTYFTSEQLLSGDYGKCAAGITDMFGTTIFKAPALKLAQSSARINPLGTFLYTIDYQGNHTRFGYEGPVSHYPFSGNVHHSDDLIYLFPYPPNVAKLNEEDTKFAMKLVDLWTSFAINGVPNQSSDINEDGINELVWQPFLGNFGSYLHIDKELKIGNDYRREFTVRSDPVNQH